MTLSKEIKAAIFVLTTIFLFIFGFNFLKGSSLFDKQKTVYAVYDEVDGLLVGANVMINGLSIGNVTDLDFLPNSTKIVVTLKVKDKINFSSNSSATIYETGVLGGLAIAIEPIFQKGMVVKSGDTLNSNIRPGLTELINRQIEPLQRKLESTLTSVDSIFSGASYVLNKETQNDIKESLNTLTSAVKAINNSIDNIESITSNLSNVSKELNNFGIAGVLSNLNSDNSSLGKLISNDEVYENLNLSIESLNLLINDIKTNPKKYVHFSVFGRK